MLFNKCSLFILFSLTFALSLSALATDKKVDPSLTDAQKTLLTQLVSDNGAEDCPGYVPSKVNSQWGALDSFTALRFVGAALIIDNDARKYVDRWMDNGARKEWMKILGRPMCKTQVDDYHDLLYFMASSHGLSRKSVFVKALKYLVESSPFIEKNCIFYNLEHTKGGERNLFNQEFELMAGSEGQWCEK